jgi:hypothetical protein
MSTFGVPSQSHKYAKLVSNSLDMAKVKHLNTLSCYPISEECQNNHFMLLSLYIEENVFFFILGELQKSVVSRILGQKPSLQGNPNQTSEK